LKKNDFVETTTHAIQFSLLESELGIVSAVYDDNVDVFFPRIGEEIKVSINCVTPVDVKQFGDQSLKKCCNVCHRIFPIEMFEKNQNGKNNRTVRRPSCRDCRKQIDGVGISISDKKKWNKSKPKLEIFTCPICEKTTIPGLNSKVVLNHDHSTGRVTGWICDSCNTGLGRFKDDTEVLKRAIDYLLGSKEITQGESVE
jgi:Recombination endonuclease VII